MSIGSRLACLVLLILAIPAIAAERLNWPEKGGPTSYGHPHPDDARRLPTTWDEDTGTNVAWKIKTEEYGHSTPVIARNQIWFTSATKDGKQQFVDHIDAKTGKVLQHKLLFENPEPEPLANAVNSYASPSCVLEHDALYFHFGSYGTARLDPGTLDVVWQRRDMPCRHFRGPGSSPVVDGELLILTFDGIDQQYVTALDKKTGHTIWRTDRSTDFHDLGPDGKPKAEGDLRKAYNTPAIKDVAGRKQLISIGSRAGFGYDLMTGKEIWTFTHPDFNAAVRPLFFDDLVLITTGSAAALYAIRVDATTQGNVDETHVVWKRAKGNPKMTSPVIVGEKLFEIVDNGVLYCLDPRTGKELNAQRIGNTFISSPVVANGLLYLCDELGVVTVVKADETLETVAQNKLTEGMRASPAVADGAIYLRTFENLYKIAATGGQ